MTSQHLMHIWNDHKLVHHKTNGSSRKIDNPFQVIKTLSWAQLQSNKGSLFNIAEPYANRIQNLERRSNLSIMPTLSHPKTFAVILWMFCAAIYLNIQETFSP